MFQMDSTGLLALVACAMCWSLAVVLYRVGSAGYEAAITEAQQGGISEKERALLNHLRDSLGISSADAAALEGGLQ
ncbi:MAG: hypothetical protein MUO51_05395 [Woeseiaceae bacterium]|nr:hypothetical protein [Woeseiaceae bacterium]